MQWKLVLGLYITVLTFSVRGNGVYEWMKYDNFDKIIDRMDAVNEFNCEAKSRDELHFPEGSVSNVVQTNKLRTSDFERNYYRNRTALLQLHSTVLANAYKYSYLFQRLNQTWNAADQPSLFYYYLGLTADVTSNLGLINGSAIFFDQNLFYPNFLTQVPINNTIPLFGPRSWRIDDFNDPANWLREPTNNTFTVTDYGAGPFRNYTIDAYKINDWYNTWLPHPWSEKDDAKSDEVSVGLQYAKDVGDMSPIEGFKFFGPPSPFISDRVDQLPVQFTRPYFDCGRSNKWVVSAVAPILDRLPRYTYDPDVPGNSSAGIYDGIRMNRRVGVAVADVDFLNIDINPCARYVDDDGKNYFAGIDRCHRESTYCKPLFGFGFQRGGYICECRPGFRYPEYIQGPYLGVAIERATEEEYKAGFHCIASSDLYMVPELNAEKGDNSGLDRLPGSVQNRKKREVEAADAELKERIAEEDRKRRAVGEMINGITTYSNAKKRFIRRVIPKAQSTLRDAREQKFKDRRVADMDSVPPEVMSELAKLGSDLGLGAKGRRLVARHKAKEEKKEKKEKAEQKRLSRKKRTAFNPVNFDRANQIFDHKGQITQDNCLSFTKEQLTLPGEVKYGVEKKLERFGRLGVRLADFLSSFLQNVDGQQDYGTLKGDKLFKEEQLFAEVISVILAEPDVEGIGLLFDTDQFKTYATLRAGSTNLREALKSLLEATRGTITTEELDAEMRKIWNGNSFIQEVTRELFGPYAYQVVESETKKDNYRAVDRAGENTRYTELEWFKDIKRRWSYNTEGLRKYILNPWIRADDPGKNIRKHEDYPLVWESAGYEAGIWSDPYFDCEGYIKDWIVSYRVPFFGNTGYGSPTEFRGVVTVDVKLDLLDIEQCPSDFFTSNAFMGTARCDYETTYCQNIENRGFRLHHGYRCNCKQGYEYPWKGTLEYFYTGDLINDAHARYLQNRTNRYKRLICRMSAASHNTATIFVVAFAALTSTLSNYIS